MTSTHLKIKSVDIQKEEIREHLKKLHSEFFRLEELIEFDSGYWWLVYDGKKPIGFCGVSPSNSWRNTGYMCRAGVKYEYRGLGLHNRLIRVRSRFSKKQGWSHLVTDTTNNCPSANNLIANGFKMYKPSKLWGLPGALNLGTWKIIPATGVRVLLSVQSKTVSYCHQNFVKLLMKIIFGGVARRLKSNPVKIP